MRRKRTTHARLSAWCSAGFLAACFLPDLAAATASESPDSGADTNSPLEKFKAFVASPPVIERIVFREKLRTDLTKPTPHDGSFALSTNWQHFEARWQPGAVFSRAIWSMDDLEGYGVKNEMVAVFGLQHWLVNYTPIATLWVDPGSGPEADNYVDSGIRFHLRILRQVLNFGVNHLEAGKIQWNGNQFETQGLIASAGMTPVITGEVAPNPQGRVGSMRCVYRIETHKVEYVTRYGYERPLDPPFFPNRITNFLVLQGKEIELAQFVIEDLKVRDEPMDESRLDPERFIQHNGWDVQVYTNRSVYARLSDGELKFLRTRNPVEQKAETLPYRAAGLQLAVIYTVWSGANLGFLLFMTKRKSRTTNQKE